MPGGSGTPGAPGTHGGTPPAPPPPEEPPRGWTRRTLVGTVLLIGIFVAIGLFAAWTVTPGPDEEALQRPADTDVVLAGGTPLSWDPAAITDGISAQVITQIFEGLTVLDADSHVRPALAESWRLEDEGYRLVFRLRDGLTFSDGSTLDADDVRRSWLRVIDPASPSPFSSLLDDVAGAAAYARGEASLEEVGIRADGDTLTLDFEHPAAFFPAVAAVPTLAVVPPSIDGQARGPEPEEPFVASGAFVPVDQELSQIRLQANERYWAGPAPMSRVTIVTDNGGRSPVDVFEDEAVDWTRVASADASWIRYDRRLGPQLRHTDEMAVQMLGFDTTEPPFDDPQVRRAVAMAVDWRRLAELDGADVPLTSIVPPGVVARPEGDFLAAHDPDGARELLAEAGYPGGSGFPAVSLATYGVGPSEAIARELAEVLGLEVKVEVRPFEQHSQLLELETPDMWTLAWSADYPHAHDFLGLLLLSESSANISGWRQPAYDALVEAAATTSDEAEQAALLAQAQAYVRDEAPLIPLGYSSSWWLAREDLRGDALSGTGILRYADLEWAG